MRRLVTRCLIGIQAVWKNHRSFFRNTYICQNHLDFSWSSYGPPVIVLVWLIHNVMLSFPDITMPTPVSFYDSYEHENHNSSCAAVHCDIDACTVNPVLGNHQVSMKILHLTTRMINYAKETWYICIVLKTLKELEHLLVMSKCSSNYNVFHCQVL